MNKIPNRQAICETLMEFAKNDKDIIVLCSDSRGSASMTPFFNAFPNQSVEVGIAEQNLVSISAGMAKLGKKAYCFSPACFISTRSYEQAKIDVAYSNTNVKLIGISGGISYGELGMSHHSAQDIAAMSAIPNMRVYLPSDRFQTAKLIEELLKDEKPAYIRVGRNPVEDIYGEASCPFKLGKATVIFDGDVTSAKTSDEADFAAIAALTAGKEKVVTLIACGEMVSPMLDAAKILLEKNIHSILLDMYSVKPLDIDAIIAAAGVSSLVVTAEEHAPLGGLGASVAQCVAEKCPKRVITKALPDDHVITGKSKAVFDYYGLNGEGFAKTVEENIQ